MAARKPGAARGGVEKRISAEASPYCAFSLADMRMLVFAAAAAFCACSAPQPPAPHPVAANAPLVRHFPQAREPADAEMQALARGELKIAGGCLRIGGGETAGDGAVIIWPAETVLSQAHGAVSVRNGRTGLVLHAGERFEMAGGFIEGVQPGSLREPLPAECPGPYWLAGSEWRAVAD